MKLYIYKWCVRKKNNVNPKRVKCRSACWEKIGKNVNYDRSIIFLTTGC